MSFILTVKTVEAKAAAALAHRRAGMTCSRLQGRLTLGPDTCAVLDAIADDPAEPWPLRETIRHATEWHRTSETIDALAWVLGYTDGEMDSLFEAAGQVRV
jgi:hypothetical protein